MIPSLGQKATRKMPPQSWATLAPFCPALLSYIGTIIFESISVQF